MTTIKTNTMRHTLPNLNKYTMTLLMASVLAFTACTPASKHLVRTKPTTKITHYEKPTEHKMAQYKQTMRSVASGIKHDSKYQRIALDTPEKKAWFRSLTYRLWDRQMTRQQFMAEGLAKYPNRRYEFQFVVDGFAKVSG